MAPSYRLKAGRYFLGMLEVGRYDALCEILKGKGSIIGLVRVYWTKKQKESGVKSSTGPSEVRLK